MSDKAQDELAYKLLIEGVPEDGDEGKVGGIVCHGCGCSGKELSGVWFVRHALVLCEKCLAGLIGEAEALFSGK